MCYNNAIIKQRKAQEEQTMNANEIKKLYTKTKKALEKRTGAKYTWVMNARQMKLGTGTVCVDYAYDYNDRIRYAEKAVNSFGTYWADRISDYTRRAREEAYYNEHTPGWYFGKNCTYWEDIIADKDKLEADRQRELQSRCESLAAYRKDREEFGDYYTCLRRSTDAAQAMIDSDEIQSFLSAIGGKAVVEVQEEGGIERVHGAFVYIRFHYTAD